jgi:hypothetical protein
MTSMGANASTSPPLRGSVASNGLNKTGDKGASLTNQVNPSNDTDILGVPSEGTLESGGING